MRARRADWRVLSLTTHEDCVAVHLAGIGPGNAGHRRILLHPFDRAVPLARRSGLRMVDGAAWVRAAAFLEAGAVSHGTLRAARDARIDLLPYQLEPVLALVHGLATRVLVADAVGLGKTIQAGLALAELRAREMSARALVITPAGLRDQWARELRERFGIEALVADAPALRRAVAALPAGVSPWDTDPVVITSCDFVKQPEVNRALEATTWDLVVVDEAHMAALARERQQAVDAIGCRARRLILLTATPHAGDDAAFLSLCRLGRLSSDDPILMFRRTAADAGLRRDRRVHLLRISLTPAEQSLHARLARYTLRVWRAQERAKERDARLAMFVLLKRAFSGVAALTRSLQHRLMSLGARPAPDASQLDLPLEDEPGVETDADDLEPGATLTAAGLPDSQLERALLGELLDLAAACSDSKTAALVRLLRRTREPAIVFTEYRDTALALGELLAPLAPVAVLHGGLDRPGRGDVERRFLGGAARVLVATDAAGQGLNLQDACRLVVNLELPWNPMRLEQRIGRVDRIGQRRTVHAINLVAGRTAEESILCRLATRFARVLEAVGHDGDPLGVRSTAVPAAPAAAIGADAAVVAPADLADLANRECARLTNARQVSGWHERPRDERGGTMRSVFEATAPWLAVIGEFETVPPGIVGVFRAPLVNGCGQLVEDVIVAVHAAFRIPLPGSLGDRARRRALSRILDLAVPALRNKAREIADARLAVMAPLVASSIRRCHCRDAAIASFLARRFSPLAAAPVQAGLFDQRELRQAAARRLGWMSLRHTLDERCRASGALAPLSLSRDPDAMLLLWIVPAR